MAGIIVLIAGTGCGYALAAQVNLECFIANKRVVAHFYFNPAQMRWRLPQAAIYADRGIFANTALDAPVKQAFKVLRSLAPDTGGLCHCAHGNALRGFALQANYVSVGDSLVRSTARAGY